MKKENNDDTQMIRISGRCKLTNKAIETIESTENKSAFYAEAINFYVTFGKNINESLNEINDKLDSIKHLKVVIDNKDIVQESVPEKVKKDIEEVSNQVVETEEERIQREKIDNLTDSFLGGMFAESGE